MSTVRTNRSHAPSEQAVRLATAGVVASYIHEISGRRRSSNGRTAAGSAREPASSCADPRVVRARSTGYRRRRPAATTPRDLHALTV